MLVFVTSNVNNRSYTQLLPDFRNIKIRKWKIWKRFTVNIMKSTIADNWLLLVTQPSRFGIPGNITSFSAKNYWVL